MNKILAHVIWNLFRFKKRPYISVIWVVLCLLIAQLLTKISAMWELKVAPVVVTRMSGLKYSIAMSNIEWQHWMKIKHFREHYKWITKALFYFDLFKYKNFPPDFQMPSHWIYHQSIPYFCQYNTVPHSLYCCSVRVDLSHVISLLCPGGWLLLKLWKTKAPSLTQLVNSRD